MTLEQLYSYRKHTPSAINEHLDTLTMYAQESKTVVELGTQSGISTTAFVAGYPELVTSYDIKFDPRLQELCHSLNFVGASPNSMVYAYQGTIWKYLLGSSLQESIPPTDLLFIDTLHTYIQLREELFLHHKKALKWIILHDTVSFGEFSEGYKDITNPAREQVWGLSYAINEFLEAHKEWTMKEHFINNNGLTVLERKK